MSAKATRYARNSREIARALGLKIKPKQLAEIGEWKQREDFPSKTRKGWVVDELRGFLDKITPELARKKLQARVADPESKTSSADFKMLVDLSGGTVAGTVQPNADCGLRIAESGGKPPEIVQGLTRLAVWIQDVYKIPCSKSSIKNWQKEVPPFPVAVSADYRYRWSEVAAWVEKNKVKPMAGNGHYADLLVKIEPERIQGELEEIAHDRMMRQVEAGAYLKKADVARACQGIGKTINGVINNRLELRLRVAALERFKCQVPSAKCQLTEEQAAFAVELFCELGRETSAALKAELRTALNQLSPESDLTEANKGNEEKP